MSDTALTILLDQNIPLAVADWSRNQRSDWNIQHVNELGFQDKPDDFLYRSRSSRSEVPASVSRTMSRHIVFWWKDKRPEEREP